MPRLSRAFAPVVVQAVVIRHRRGHQFVDVDAVEAHDVDVVVFGAAHIRHVDSFERPGRRNACRTGDARPGSSRDSP